MRTSWQTETGHLVLHWSGVVLRVQHNLSWLPIQGRYLPPLLLDFASRSPFGGACWFHPRPAAVPFMVAAPLGRTAQVVLRGKSWRNCRRAQNHQRTRSRN
jgi:hypothetical protein